MPFDPQSIADPRFLVVSWAAGLAIASAFIARSGVVGRGFIWLAGGTSALLALPGAFGGSWLAIGALLLLVMGTVSASRPSYSWVFLVIAGALLLLDIQPSIGWLATLTSAIALGGVTAEMMLGHWYLVDPRLPRASLRYLALAAIAGLVLDGTLMAYLGATGGGGWIAFAVLVLTSIALMVGVIAALRYPAYSGVMAATGLSYLAVLTSLGATFLGRALVAGLGPFSI